MNETYKHWLEHIKSNQRSKLEETLLVIIMKIEKQSNKDPDLEQV
jgi:hypothetical protein